MIRSDSGGKLANFNELHKVNVLQYRYCSWKSRIWE